MSSQNRLLAAEGIEFSYNGHPILDGLGVQLGQSDLIALLGPNGSGKTTLLKLLCGILTPQKGRISWDGSRLTGMNRRAIARRIALVPQELNVPFAFTVTELVALGRTPHMSALRGETVWDREAVTRALALTDTTDLAERYFGDLSGGERQRVVVAMALAQIAPAISPDRNGDLTSPAAVLLLDEPTVHLDINHQVEVLELVRRLNREFGLTVLATMHDLNLASLYFDRILILHGGTIVTEGSPVQVLSKERVESVFGAKVSVENHPMRENVPQFILLPTNGKNHR